MSHAVISSSHAASTIGRQSVFRSAARLLVPPRRPQAAIIDDLQEDKERISGILKNEGFEVVPFDDNPESYGMFLKANGSISAYLVDMVMKVHGEESGSTWKDTISHVALTNPTASVILISSYVEEVERIEAKAIAQNVEVVHKGLDEARQLKNYLSQKATLLRRNYRWAAMRRLIGLGVITFVIGMACRIAAGAQHATIISGAVLAISMLILASYPLTRFKASFSPPLVGGSLGGISGTIAAYSLLLRITHNESLRAFAMIVVYLMILETLILFRRFAEKV